MAFRVEAAAIGFLIAALAQADVTVPVRHDHLRGHGAGRLVATDDGLRFEEESGKKEHSWHLKWQDIQQLWIGMREVRVTTYADSRVRLGADREHRLEAAPDSTFEPLYAMTKERMDQRLVAALPSELAGTLWELPVKLKKGFGGSEGLLSAASDGIVYRSPEKDESRTWRMSDIESVSTAGPFDLTIVTYEGGQAYTFQLKQRLDERQYQALWRRLNESKQSEILR